jgi:hypothetical protein
LAAVVISLITAFVYPRMVLAVSGEQRNYLIAYGLRDYMYVFALTIVSACLAFLLWRLAQWLCAMIKAFAVLMTTPNAQDEPIVILKKLGRLGERVVFRQAHAAGGNANQLVLVLEPWREPAHLWIAPPARLEPAAQTPAAALNFVQQVANGEVTSARQLAKRIKKGLATQGAMVEVRRAQAAVVDIYMADRRDGRWSAKSTAD